MILLPLLSLPLAIAQAAPAETPTPPPAGNAAPVDARAQECLQIASNDPVSGITTASTWLGEGAILGVTHAQECLGHAYVRLLRWEAAEEAFLAAREAESANPGRRARLAAMAGNAAMAGTRHVEALSALDMARGDAAAAGDGELAAGIALDRAHTLVGLGRPDEAAAALTEAREAQPQNAEAWLLSATLARRMERLSEAQAMIESAAALIPTDPRVGLEAGVIAALAGHEEAARKSWQSVVELDRDPASVQQAQAYLAQLGGAGAEKR
jgi:tetratricopeptide (TPR) repeat protein